MVRLLCSLIFSLIIGIICGYQLIGLSRDFENYAEFFEIVREAVDYLNINYRFEPGFSALVYGLTRIGFDNYFIYSTIVILFVFIKYFSIEFSDKYFFVIFLFTFYLICRYIVLFEMTILRAGCAFSLAFYVFYRKSDYSIKWVELAILVVAIMFHYSAVVFILLYFLKPTSLNKILIFTIVIFVFIYIVKTIIVLYFSEYSIFIASYENFGEAAFLPIPFILDILFLLFIIFRFKSADISMQYAILGMAFGIAFHFSLIDYVVLASRFRELLSIFFLIYVVRSVYCDDDNVRYASYSYVLLSSLMHLYVYFIHDPLLL